MEDAPLLRKPEVAKRLGVSDRTVDRLIAAGELAVVRMGRRMTRITPESVDAYIARAAA